MGELTTTPGAKSQAVRSVLETFRPNQTFTIADLERACPTVSRATTRRVLGELRARGQVECLGKGRSAQWRKV